ncbi:MAG: DUF3667 domain-containing protein [Parasphingopyxis sp.]|nr:DUF3667 domain-containing protein [Sphingomonadales bacterium]
MESDIESIGTAITGGLAARAVEPGHGEVGGEGDGEARVCANCATELVGTHCHFCGQKARVHRSLAAIFHELIHGVLHLDGKFWRTLPLLCIRPGELTRRYAEGERAKFVSPLGMFLFSVFLMFAILQVSGASLSNLAGDTGTVFNPGAAQANLEERLTQARADRAAIDRQIAAAADPEQRTELEGRAAELDEDIAGLEEGEEVLASIGGSEDGEGNSIGFTTRWDRLDRGIAKINENPDLALYKLQANGYKFSWLLIPISVPFVWVLFFYTRRYRLYDHTVFVTYSLAFMSLLAIALTALGFAGLGSTWIAAAALIIPLFHIYKQLKYGYRLGRVGALIRTALLANFCFITASFYFVLLLGIGALG